MQEKKRIAQQRKRRGAGKKRTKRIPSTMTRRSREIVTQNNKRRGRRDSIGTRVHNGVDRLNKASSMAGRIEAALNLARNVV